MGVIAYKKQVSSGQWKQFYLVVAEAINRYTGKRVQKKRRSIPSKPKAQLIYKELWNLCREERPDKAELKNWGELVSRFLESIREKVRSEEKPDGLSPRVYENKKSRLAHAKDWEGMHLDLVTPAFVDKELDRIEQNHSRTLANHVLQEVRCAFAFAVSLGAIKANPFLETKARRVPKKRKVALNHNELDILLTQAKIRRHPYYYVWLLTVSLGLRRSELAGLKWTDVDFDMGVIHLTRQIIAREGLVPHLKDKEDRSVAIPDYLIPVLKEMKLKATSEFVIELNCESWTMGRQAQVLREFCVEIGIKEVTHRQLRSTHITLALIDGVPLGIVKENVGHTKLSTTDEYFCSSGIQMAGQMNKLRIQIPSDQLATVHAIKPAT